MLELSNGVLAPEPQRGGVVLGVSIHSGKQVNAFDSLQFDKDDVNSPKFLDALQRALVESERKFANGPQELLAAKHKDARDLYIYQRYLEI